MPSLTLSHRVAPDGFVLGVDRSPRALEQARRVGAAEISAGLLAFALAAVEDLDLPDEPPFDLAFALRVGALDGRHPEAARRALPRIAAVLRPSGVLLVDGGTPLRELPLPR